MYFRHRCPCSTSTCIVFCFLCCRIDLSRDLVGHQRLGVINFSGFHRDIDQSFTASSLHNYCGNALVHSAMTAVGRMTTTNHPLAETRMMSAGTGVGRWGTGDASPPHFSGRGGQHRNCPPTFQFRKIAKHIA